MNNVTEIRWSADDEGVLVLINKITPTSTIWSDPAGHVKDACEREIDDELWDEWVPLGDNELMLNVEVHSPPEIAGHYAVRLERKIKADARPIKEKGC